VLCLTAVYKMLVISKCEQKAANMKYETISTAVYTFTVHIT